MAAWKLLLFICAALIFVDGKRTHHQKRETISHLCDPAYNNTNKIQCFCVKDSHEENLIRSAECYSTVNGIPADDPNWEIFVELENVYKLTFTNTRGIVLKYVPKQALKYTKSIIKLEIKYANIETIESFDFANLTFIEELTLRDNHIKILKKNALAHHRDLVILGLDSNSIVEINRNVFVDLPSLEKLYLTSNKVTTIHDKAFIHLTNLRELEIDRNHLFSLNSETFSGLSNLEKLDLSSNSLEVIGDNTFLPLKNLQSLNLNGNKIQMLDEKAFHGLINLQSLSLAHNSLKEIKNTKIFMGLKSLKVLSLKGNKIRNLDPEVMAPILENLYSNVSSLDVEDNSFPCDCHLDWFLALMNNTRSSYLKLAIENLKCNPSTEIKDRWIKSLESDKNTQDVESDVQGNDYDYYDESQLNGKLFYVDMRFLLNCSGNYDSLLTPQVDLKSTPMKIDTTTTLKPPIITTHAVSFKVDTIINNDYIQTEHVTEQTTKLPNFENMKGNDRKTNIYTTTRLSTVSAKPIANEYYDNHNMAADEGKPDKIKAHRSIQENFEDAKEKYNSANKKTSCISLFAVVFSIRYFL